jgi:hypothetical protein
MIRRPTPPGRAVVASEVGPRSARLRTPNGWLILCGIQPLRRDTLECGHVIETHDIRRTRRRCWECIRPQEQLPLVEAEPT